MPFPMNTSTHELTRSRVKQTYVIVSFARNVRSSSSARSTNHSGMDVLRRSIKPMLNVFSQFRFQTVIRYFIRFNQSKTFILGLFFTATALLTSCTPRFGCYYGMRETQVTPKVYSQDLADCKVPVVEIIN